MFEILIFFVFAVIIGLMFLFFGYPFFRILLPIWAFFAGLMFGVQGIESLMGTGFIPLSLGLILGFILGLVLAGIAYYVFELAVYLFGATIGYVLGAGLMTALGLGPGFLSGVVGLVVAVILAVLFVKTSMPRFLIIVLTAAAGAMAVFSGVFALFGAVPAMSGALQMTELLVTGSWFWLMLWLVLTVFGMAFQYVLVTVNNEMSQKELNEVYVWDKEYKKKKK